MSSAYQKLEQIFEDLYLQKSIISMLNWDAATYMPEGSASFRGEQLAWLEGQYQNTLAGKKTEDLFLQSESEGSSLSEIEKINLSEMKRMWLEAKATPTELLLKLIKLKSSSEVQWRKAYQNSDFKSVSANLEQIIEITQEIAEAKSKKLDLSPYDALLISYEPDIKSAEIDGYFAEIKEFLPQLINEVIEKQSKEKIFEIKEAISVDAQKSIAKDLIKKIGFDFKIGRLDESTHPFTEGVPEDIRITARYDTQDMHSGLAAVMHEMGHALYDQNLPKKYKRKAIAKDKGMSIHESQSLFFEMTLLRSQAFSNFLNPLLLENLKINSKALSSQNLFKNFTKVKKDFIRVDADELTYTSHIIFRYQLEKDLLSGKLKVKDLPEAFNESMKEVLGIYPANDRVGCLQDVHWYMGLFGYFPTYALGAMLSAQIFQSINKSLSDFNSQIERGDFSQILLWLKKNIYEKGAMSSTQELIKSATGTKLDTTIYRKYLMEKYKY